jgi:hypothetical protein
MDSPNIFKGTNESHRREGSKARHPTASTVEVVLDGAM